jgi:cytochrome b6-f complex iron-sulfur subunit
MEPTKPKDESCSDCPRQKSHLWGRRDVLVGLGWGTLATAALGTGAGLLRFMFPKVLFEPSGVFKAGWPHEYAVGTVDARWIKEQRVWIIRQTDHIYALSAICTHLGCTPAWLQSEDKFKCPCHGSGFHKDGVNYEGPAPRSLERYKISLASDGQLLVDKRRKFLFEKNEWSNPESFLMV